SSSSSSSRKGCSVLLAFCSSALAALSAPTSSPEIQAAAAAAAEAACAAGDAAAAIWCGFFRCLRKSGGGIAVWPDWQAVQRHLQQQQLQELLLLLPFPLPRRFLLEQQLQNATLQQLIQQYRLSLCRAAASAGGAWPWQQRQEQQRLSVALMEAAAAAAAAAARAHNNSTAAARANNNGDRRASDTVGVFDLHQQRALWAEAAAACCSLSKWEALPPLLHSASKAAAAAAASSATAAEGAASSELSLAMLPQSDSTESRFLLQHSRLLLLVRRIVQQQLERNTQQEEQHEERLQECACMLVGRNLHEATVECLRPLTAALKDSAERAATHLSHLHIFADLELICRRVGLLVDNDERDELHSNNSSSNNSRASWCACIKASTRPLSVSSQCSLAALLVDRALSGTETAPAAEAHARGSVLLSAAKIALECVQQPVAAAAVGLSLQQQRCGVWTPGAVLTSQYKRIETFLKQQNLQQEVEKVEGGVASPADHQQVLCWQQQLLENLALNMRLETANQLLKKVQNARHP
ncbi:uncharacterized protein LOC34624102, partial [Cyclospora cayetanensis]|uniref:Uncharacterized protein LOC34624102 n=1 Tax=Cyclospora cayetanensis TaxID=88456 RepID=A0A6P6S506_9EIME